MLWADGLPHARRTTQEKAAAGVPNPNSLSVKRPILLSGEAANRQPLLPLPPARSISDLSQPTLIHSSPGNAPTAYGQPDLPRESHPSAELTTRRHSQERRHQQSRASIHPGPQRGLQATGVQTSSCTPGRIALAESHRSPEKRLRPLLPQARVAKPIVAALWSRGCLAFPVLHPNVFLGHESAHHYRHKIRPCSVAIINIVSQPILGDSRVEPSRRPDPRPRRSTRASPDRIIWSVQVYLSTSCASFALSGDGYSCHWACVLWD